MSNNKQNQIADAIDELLGTSLIDTNNPSESDTPILPATNPHNPRNLDTETTTELKAVPVTVYIDKPLLKQLKLIALEAKMSDSIEDKEINSVSKILRIAATDWLKRR